MWADNLKTEATGMLLPVPSTDDPTLIAFYDRITLAF